MPTTNILDLLALIFQGIADAGGVPEDANLLTEEDVISLGRLVAERGMRQRSPNAKLDPAPKFLPLPKDGEVFELTIDGDAVDPIEMVRGDGYNNPEQWQFNGPKVVGTQTRRFKLVGVGYQRNGGAINKVIAKHGTPALGQYREAFKEKYGCRKLVGFTGSEWVDPFGRRFPCVREGFSDFFLFFDEDFDDRWRFAVEVK